MRNIKMNSSDRKMDSTDAGRGNDVSLSLDEFISENGLVRWPRADIWTGVGAGMLWK